MAIFISFLSHGHFYLFHITWPLLLVSISHGHFHEYIHTYLIYHLISCWWFLGSPRKAGTGWSFSWRHCMVMYMPRKDWTLRRRSLTIVLRDCKRRLCWRFTTTVCIALAYSFTSITLYWGIETKGVCRDLYLMGLQHIWGWDTVFFHYLSSRGHAFYCPCFLTPQKKFRLKISKTKLQKRNQKS